MPQVENPTLPYHMAIPLGAFLLSRTPRFSKYLPGASTGGLALSAAAGSTFVALGRERVLTGSAEDRLNRFLKTTALMILGNLFALVVGKTLKGRIALSFPAKVKLIGIEGLCNGILTIALHSESPAEPIPQAPKEPKASLHRIVSLPKDVFNHMLLNLDDPETIRYARLSFAIKLEEKGDPLSKKDFIREPHFWKMYFTHHFSSIMPLKAVDEEVCKKVCCLTRQFFGYTYTRTEKFERAVNYGYEKFVYRALFDLNRMYPLRQTALWFDIKFLHIAQNKQYEKIVEIILDIGANAAANCDYLTLRGLLAAKASISCKNSKGETPLHKAAGHGPVENAMILLEAQASVDVKDNSGETPLHKAAMSRQFEIVKALLEANASVLSRNDRGETPLREAVWASTFLEAGAAPE